MRSRTKLYYGEPDRRHSFGMYIAVRSYSSITFHRLGGNVDNLILFGNSSTITTPQLVNCFDQPPPENYHGRVSTLQRLSGLTPRQVVPPRNNYLRPQPFTSLSALTRDFLITMPSPLSVLSSLVYQLTQSPGTTMSHFLPSLSST